MSLIQHLNIIVDPQAPALSDYDPPSTVTGGGTPADSTPDPTEAGRNPYGRLVRTGGSGIQNSRRKKRHPKGRQFAGLIAANAAFGGHAETLTLPNPVVANDLLVAFVFGNANAATTVSLTDNQSNTWTRAGSYQRVAMVSAGLNFFGSLWYCLNPVGGALTLTTTVSGPYNPVYVSVREYDGDYNLATFDAAGGAGVATGTPVLSSGSITVAGARGLVTGALFGTLPARLITADFPFHVLEFNNTYTGGTGNFVPVDLVTGTSIAVTGTQITATGFSPAYSPYIALGASFRPHP